jgi:hypothetical protein
MELFTIVQNKDNILFHGTGKKCFDSIEHPMWFAHSKKDAKAYGSNLFTVKLKRNVKLLDISHGLFHHDFMNKVNSIEPSKISIDNYAPLLALGIPNIQHQVDVVGLQKDGIYPQNQKDNQRVFDAIEVMLPMFGDKHRLSIQGNVSTDKHMIDAMMKLYPSFDGYTCKTYWPSYHHGGFLSPETCLFHPNTCIEIVTVDYVGGKKKFQTEKTNTKNKQKNTNSKKGENTNNGKPGYRKNEFGGHTWSLEWLCEDTGMTFDDFVRGPIFLK